LLSRFIIGGIIISIVIVIISIIGIIIIIIIVVIIVIIAIIKIVIGIHASSHVAYVQVCLHIHKRFNASRFVAFHSIMQRRPLVPEDAQRNQLASTQQT